MRYTEISLPELAIIAGTRGAIGAGLGLLLADRLDERRRQAVGWTLLAVGLASTIPLAIDVLGRSRSAAARRDEPGLSLLRDASA